MMVKKRKALIFGTGSFAEMVDFYLSRDSNYEVVGFTGTKDSLSGEVFNNRTVIPFDEVTERFPPVDFEMFIAIGYSKLNRLREQFCSEAREKGYRLLSYISSRATHWDETELGDNVFIFENNVIQPFVTIGNGTILWSGNHIGHHTNIDAYCFITSHAVVSGHCHVGSHSFIGVNATVTDGVSIGKRNIIGPGTLIRKTTGDDEVYVEKQTKKFSKDSSKFFR